MFWSDAKTQFCPKGLGAEKRQGRGSGELIHRGGKLEEGWGRSHLALGRSSGDGEMGADRLERQCLVEINETWAVAASLGLRLRCVLFAWLTCCFFPSTFFLAGKY